MGLCEESEGRQEAETDKSNRREDIWGGVNLECMT